MNEIKWAVWSYQMLRAFNNIINPSWPPIEVWRMRGACATFVWLVWRWSTYIRQTAIASMLASSLLRARCAKQITFKQSHIND